MKKILSLMMVLFFIVFLLPQSNAQNDTPKPKFMVWEVKVTPAQLSKSLDAIKAQHDFLKDQNYPYSGLVQYTNDGLLWYSTPFQNYSEIDKMNAVDEKLWSENAEKSKEIQKKFEGAYQAVGSSILELQPELSILPAQEAETPTGQRFRFFERFYIKQGKGKEFAEATKKYKALREKHEYTDAFYVLYPSFGPNLSIVYFIDEMGNSPAEHYTQSDQKWERFGEEGQKLWQEVMPLLEKVETHIGWADYDVSFYPNN